MHKCQKTIPSQLVMKEPEVKFQPCLLMKEAEVKMNQQQPHSFAQKQETVLVCFKAKSISGLPVHRWATTWMKLHRNFRGRQLTCK